MCRVVVPKGQAELQANEEEQQGKRMRTLGQAMFGLSAPVMDDEAREVRLNGDDVYAKSNAVEV